MNFDYTPKTRMWIERVSAFMDEHIYPREQEVAEEVQAMQRSGKWQTIASVEALKDVARAEGLWNMFLPGSEQGQGLSNIEYAPLAELMGRVGFASEVFNCSAPDTGNMEVLERYGSEAQKQQWLQPLLDGEIRSAFAMTEPDVASSDATNICATAVADGDEYIINGRKWWTSGVGDPRCKLLVFMCVTDPNAPKHQRQSQILVPLNSPGIKIDSMLSVFGYDGAPHGHGLMSFDNVRVPKSNMLLGEGRGFEIAQGRLGPGRIHHCMRFIGVAERALEYMCKRSLTRVAFGKKLSDLGANMDYIAEARIEINMARLLTLHAAHMMDTVGNKAARSEIAQIKVVAPSMALKIIDRAIQIHGAAGVSQFFPLAQMYANIRSIRIGDGPDEVHRHAVARAELAHYDSK